MRVQVGGWQVLDFLSLSVGQGHMYSPFPSTKNVGLSFSWFRGLIMTAVGPKLLLRQQLSFIDPDNALHWLQQ